MGREPAQDCGTVVRVVATMAYLICSHEKCYALRDK